MSVSELRSATRADPLLARVRHCLQQGWPHKIPPELLPYWRRRGEMTLEGDCVLWGMRVVIPVKFQSKVLAELHQGHPGIVRMKSIARSHVWWPELDMAIEGCAKSCSACQVNKVLGKEVSLYF